MKKCQGSALVAAEYPATVGKKEIGVKLDESATSEYQGATCSAKRSFKADQKDDGALLE
ncbi:hypothetical protein ACSBO6_18625 [Bacillus sp. AL-1R]